MLSKIKKEKAQGGLAFYIMGIMRVMQNLTGLYIFDGVKRK